MDITSLLNNKVIRPTHKREEIAEAIRMKHVTIHDIQSLRDALDVKKMALILEAMEAVTSKNPEIADVDWVRFSVEFILAKSNPLKREASRIIGNIAHLFPNDLEIAVHSLLENTKNDGTVIRWGSAYALARIIQIPQYANSTLYDTLTDLSEREQENSKKIRPPALTDGQFYN